MQLLKIKKYSSHVDQVEIYNEKGQKKPQTD